MMSPTRSGLILWVAMLARCGGGTEGAGSPDPACGNGVVENGEECDDGAANSDTDPDACRATCVNPACGDGVIDDGEACDDGDANTDDDPAACRPDCFRLVLWTQTYDTGDFDYVNDVAVDVSGNVVVVGSQGEAEASDLWVRKLDPDGETLWTQTYAGAAGMRDAALGVAVDEAGNVIVAGYETMAAGGTDAWIRKYDPDGETVWTRTNAGAAGGDDKASSVAVDATGSILVVGEETTGAGDTDLWLRKYEAGGGTSWTQMLDGFDDDDRAHGVAADATGNALAGGYSDGGPAPTSWILKYDAQGDPVWAKERSLSGTSLDYVNAIASVSTDAVVVGHGIAAGPNVDARIERVDANGESVWVRSHDGGQGDLFVDVGVDPSGDLLAVGWSEIDETRVRDGLLLKYAQNGDVVWMRSYDTGGDDLATAVAAGPDGTIVAVGDTFAGDPSAIPPSRTASDTWIRKYGP